MNVKLFRLWTELSFPAFALPGPAKQPGKRMVSVTTLCPKRNNAKPMILLKFKSLYKKIKNYLWHAKNNPIDKFID